MKPEEGTPLTLRQAIVNAAGEACEEADIDFNYEEIESDVDLIERHVKDFQNQKLAWAMIKAAHIGPEAEDLIKQLTKKLGVEGG
jgi:hypothetical protein